MISILMPLYNGVEFLRESLSSVIAQTYEEWELLIGINGYPPNSDIFKRVSNYNSNKIRVLDLPEVSGKSEALNEMLKETKQDLICLIDVDDIWAPLKLEHQIQFINSYDIVGTNAVYFGDRQDSPAIPLNEITRDDFFRVNPVINSSAMFRKKDARWENYEGVEDYEMWCRLAKDGKKFFNIPHVLVKHRIHNKSAFNTQSYTQKILEIKSKHGFV